MWGGGQNRMHPLEQNFVRPRDLMARGQSLKLHSNIFKERKDVKLKLRVKELQIRVKKVKNVASLGLCPHYVSTHQL